MQQHNEILAKRYRINRLQGRIKSTIEANCYGFLVLGLTGTPLGHRIWPFGRGTFLFLRLCQQKVCRDTFA